MTGVPLNIDWQQILLHLFNFTILFGALYILLYKPVRDFMAKRTAYYADMDARAEDALKIIETGCVNALMSRKLVCRIFGTAIYCGKYAFRSATTFSVRHAGMQARCMLSLMPRMLQSLGR